jgi:hypothetical protein
VYYSSPMYIFWYLINITVNCIYIISDAGVKIYTRYSLM